MYTGLVYLVFVRADYHSGLMTAVLVALGVQLLATLFAVATDIRTINTAACYGGLIGVWLSLAVSVFVACSLYMLAMSWPRDQAGKRSYFVNWILVWMFFNSACVLAQLRSLLLCTV